MEIGSFCASHDGGGGIKKSCSLCLLVETGGRFLWHRIRIEISSFDISYEGSPIAAMTMNNQVSGVATATAVVLGSRIYLLGGASPIPLSQRRSKYKKSGRVRLKHNRVLYFDTLKPEDCWKTGPPMRASRVKPSAIVANGKIYVFGGGGTIPADNIEEEREENEVPLFGEVLDPISDEWEPLTQFLCDATGDRSAINRSTSLLLYSSFDESLHYFDNDSKSWIPHELSFGYCDQFVVLDDVLYTYSEFSIKCYDFIANRWLPNPLKLIKSDRDRGDDGDLQDIFPPKNRYVSLFHLGNKTLLMVWTAPSKQKYDHVQVVCTIFTIGNPRDSVGTDDYLVATVESSSSYHIHGNICTDFVLL